MNRAPNVHKPLLESWKEQVSKSRDVCVRISVSLLFTTMFAIRKQCTALKNTAPLELARPARRLDSNWSSTKADQSARRDTSVRTLCGHWHTG